MTELVPTSGRGLLLFIGAAVIAVISFYTTSLGALILGAAIIAILLYAFYVIGVRLHRWAIGLSRTRRPEQITEGAE